MKWLTKKKLFILTLLWNIFFGGIIFLVQTRRCGRGTWCDSLVDGIESIGISESLIIFFFVLFLLSIFLLFISDSVFTRWKKFAIFSTPIVIILSILTSIYGKGGSMPGQFDAIYLVAPILYGWYFIHSFTIIIRAWRKEKTNNS